MNENYRIVFKGQIQDGFDLALVKKVASLRLKASPEQIERLFSGRKVIIKKNLTAKASERYLAELDKIGMVASVEQEAAAGNTETAPAKIEQDATEANAQGANVQTSLNLSNTIADSMEAATEEPQFDPVSTHLNEQATPGDTGATSSAEQTDFDPHKTHVNFSLAEALLNQAGPPLPAPEPTPTVISDATSASDAGPESQFAHLTQPPQIQPDVSESAKQAEAPHPAIAAISLSPTKSNVVHCPCCGEDISALFIERNQSLPDSNLVFPIRPFAAEKPSERKTPLHSAWQWFRARVRN